MKEWLNFNTEKKIVNIVLLALAIVSMVAMVVLTLEYRNPSLMEAGLPEHYGNGWLDLNEHTLITEQYITVLPNESKTILKRLPDSLPDNSCFKCYGSNMEIEVRIPGTDQTTVSKEDRSFNDHDRTIGLYYRLSSEAAGQNMLLTFSNYSLWPVRVNMHEFYIGSVAAMISQAWHDSLRIIILSILMVGLALVLLFFVAFLMVEDYDRYRSVIAYIAAVLICAAVWFYRMTAIAILGTSHSAASMLLILTAYFALGPLSLLVYREIIPNRHRELTHWTLFFSAVTLIVLMIYVFNPYVSMWTILTVSHIQESTCVILSMVYSLVEYRKEKSEILRDGIISCVLFLAGGGITITQMYLWPIFDAVKIYRIFFLLGVLNLLFVILESAWNQYDDRRVQNHFRELAYKDPVTGGHSAAYLEEELSQRDMSRDYWFIYLNIKRFKIINGTIGKDKADRFLCTLYSGLESKIDLEEGERIGYLGNANFGALVVADNEVALKGRLLGVRYQMLRILDEFLSGLHIQSETCIYHIEAQEQIDLRQVADYCLMASGNPNAEYIAILNGYLYNERCRQKLLREEELQNMLAAALAAKDIKPYYQPKIDPQTGRIVGAEALARWENKQYGLIQPGEFIPIFEQNGSIADVDLTIFEQVCEQIMTWIHNGKTPPVISVNYSKAYILMKNQFYRYQRIIDRIGVPPQYLEFEFTESLAYDDMEQIHELMDAIHSIGARCAMDDFGKSYSNLNALGDLPFDVVKMDMSFFSYGFPSNERQMRMVKDTVRLLQDLQTDVVTEGIESAEQVNVLRDLHVTAIQGFYYSKPLPADEFEQYMESRKNK